MKYEYHSLFLKTVIFLLIIFITGFSHASGSKGVVKKQTKQECNAVGGRVTNFTELQERHLQQEISSQLQHGESAWIEGYAKFSPFLAWHGCVASLKDVPYVTNHSLDTPNLYACVKKCAQRKINETYMGIELTICFCFTEKINEAKFKSVSSVMCSTPCSTTSMDMCGGTNFTSLYRIVDNIAWAENEPSPRQCVNVIKRQERFSASTSSCFTLSLPKYICTRQLSSKLNSSLCYRSDDLEQYCLIRKRSTRQEAFSGCLDKYGTLIEYYGEEKSLSLMQVGARYWLSVFRTFEPSKRKNTNGMGCLSVTKISDNLYLDPDSCVIQKPYLCQISNSRATTLSKSKNAPYPTRTYNSTKPVATSTKDSKYHADDSSSLPTTFADRSSKSPATVVTTKDSVYNTTSALTTESAVANTQRLSEKNCSFKQCSLQPLSLSLSLDTVTMPLEQTTVTRTATPKPPLTSNSFKQINSSFVILHTTNQINVNSTIPKQMSSNRNKKEPQLIYYILLSSFVFIISVIIAICLVVCMRKRKQQLQSHKKGHKASAVSEGIKASFSRNYQNLDRNASNTAHYAVTEIGGLENDSKKDQYDRIHFIELKTEDCHQINQYDHTAHGATSNYNNMGYTSFTCTEGRNSDSFSSFDSDYSKVAGSDYHIQGSDSGEQDEDHIYHVPTCDE